MTQPPVPAVNIDTARERVVERLSVLYANDHLSLEELESRLDRAYAARTSEALSAVMSGLPAELAAVTPAPVPEQHADKRSYIAVMSGIVRRGTWIVPKRMRAVAFMGGIELDLRHAKLSPGVTEIRIVAVMGGVVVTVPPNVRLECDGWAFMGGFEDQLKEPASRDPNAPVVKLTGLAFMGGVEARVRGPYDTEDEEE
jgi:hypothetical protein